MMQTLTEQAPSASRLDRRDSARVLERAIEERASIRLRVGVDGVRMAWSGTVTGANPSCLKLEIHNVDSGSRAFLTASILEAVVCVDGAQYTFATQCVGAVPSAETGAIQILRPARIHLIERRRSPRWLLREPCDVTVRAAGAGERRPCRGHMFNLSTDGIACRVDREEVSRIPIGQSVRVDFRIAADAEAFQLSGRIVTLTPGAEAGHVVVGIEFIDEADTIGTKARLQAALQA